MLTITLTFERECHQYLLLHTTQSHLLGYTAKRFSGPVQLANGKSPGFDKMNWTEHFFHPADKQRIYKSVNVYESNKDFQIFTSASLKFKLKGQ